MVEDIIKMRLEEILIDKIDIGEGNVREDDITKNMDELKKSIKLIGLQQPPIVFPKGDRYELIVGQRRLIALKQLGWEKIPVLIREPLDLTDAKIVSLSENIQRVKLSARDMSDVCSYLLEKLGSPKAVADALGISYPNVNKHLGYRIVPESIKKLVEENPRKITPDYARKICERYLPYEEKALEMLKKLIKKKMTPDEKERVLDAIEESPEESSEKIFKKAEKAKSQEIIIILPEKYMAALENASKKLGAKPEDVAKTAVTTWLRNEGYLRLYE